MIFQSYGNENFPGENFGSIWFDLRDPIRVANVESSSLSAIFLEILKIRRNRFLNLNIAFTKYLRWIILLNPSLRSIRVFLLLFFQIRNIYIYIYIYIYIWYISRMIIKSFFFVFFFFKIKIIHEKNWIRSQLNIAFS